MDCFEDWWSEHGPAIWLRVSAVTPYSTPHDPPDWLREMFERCWQAAPTDAEF